MGGEMGMGASSGMGSFGPGMGQRGNRGPEGQGGQGGMGSFGPGMGQEGGNRGPEGQGGQGGMGFGGECKSSGLHNILKLN
jgi:hypothetical protein